MEKKENEEENYEPSPALDWLMTYGWAVLVVLTAVGALIYFMVTK